MFIEVSDILDDTTAAKPIAQCVGVYSAVFGPGLTDGTGSEVLRDNDPVYAGRVPDGCCCSCRPRRVP